MDAAIYRDNGTLIVDFRTPVKLGSMHRDVTVENILSDPKVIKVRAKKVNWDSKWDMYSEKFDLADPKNIAKVLPEYIEEWVRPALGFMELPLYGKERKEWKTPKIITRIKPGWFEYKDTNHLVEITASNFIIYNDSKSLRL